MNSRSKALIRYYTRLIQKGTYKIEDVPEELRSYVQQVLDAATEAQTPAENAESK
jgi:hypothetical protein